MPKTSCVVIAAALSFALANMASAAEGPWTGETSASPGSQKLSRDAQRALICQAVTDWAAYQITGLIRDDARENEAVSPEGMQILRQIRLTEALASAAFDKLAPEADHDSMYRDAVKKMQAYLKEDHDGADANTKQMVPQCQRTYQEMADAGELSEEQIKQAKEESRESVTKLRQELEGGIAPQ